MQRDRLVLGLAHSDDGCRRDFPGEGNADEVNLSGERTAIRRTSGEIPQGTPKEQAPSTEGAKLSGKRTEWRFAHALCALPLALHSISPFVALRVVRNMCRKQRQAFACATVVFAVARCKPFGVFSGVLAVP